MTVQSRPLPPQPDIMREQREPARAGSARQGAVSYGEFLGAKMHTGADTGFEPTFMPKKAFDFQQALIAYAVRKGRAALFEDCGLGKTLQFLAWAQNVI